MVIRILAKSAFEPATQEQELCWPCRLMGPSRHFACEQQSGRLQVKADIRRQAGPAASVAIDPKETLTFELQDHDHRRHLLSEISANAIQSVVCF
jgi:hypothetical protein